jgi:hypothetical protein
MAYDNTNEENYEPRSFDLNDVLKKIADVLIESPVVNPDILNQNQKTFRDGLVSIGRENSDKLITYQSETLANQEDLALGDNGQSLQSIVDSMVGTIAQVDVQLLLQGDDSLGSIILTNNGISYNVTSLITNTILNEDGTETIQNPINVSQFLNISKISQNVDPDLAKENLDINIHELLPTPSTRQERVDKFFEEFDTLKGWKPDFEINNGLVSDEFIASGSDEYSEDHDISAAQNTPDIGITEEESYITRLVDDENSNNQGKSLQSLRDNINEYLKDIDQEFPEPQDERPGYTNRSDGYIKFRNLNQGIIIRNTQQPFLDGLHPENEEYLDTGFTITQWVRFKDKVSQGTLFNFGSPTRDNDPFGFKLETFVLNKNDKYGMGSCANATWHEMLVERTCQQNHGGGWDYNESVLDENFFANSDTERFVRLVVRENLSTIRSSHMMAGGVSYRRPGCPEFGNLHLSTEDDFGDENGYTTQSHLILHTRIPVDSQEWYFICATYDPDIKEDESYVEHSDSDWSKFDFWMGNLDGDGHTYKWKTGWGAKCKVEIISKTDLLRARGYKV